MERTGAVTGAMIKAVVPESPADDAGFYEGCRLLAVDGEPLRDIIDWRWLASDDEIELSYIDADGDVGTIVLVRDPGEDWGFEFTEAIFDSTHVCRNTCTFCFMRQLPKGMRRTLSVRDDDFRLSFLTGTFVTLTNLSDADVNRIVEQRISPLRVSLHAVDPGVRLNLIGRHAMAGIDNLKRLLSAGIEFDAQIVLVPGVNDGSILDETLEWAYSQEGIKTVGIVPLGFTRYQDDFDRSFDVPVDALRVISQVERFQSRALSERDAPWVYAADEFYRNAYGSEMLDKLPPASFYGDFAMYEDGIGIIRSAVDDFREAVESGKAKCCADALRASGMKVAIVCGEAMLPYTDQMLEASPCAGFVRTLPVKNSFFGGNVNVTGLLTGQDIAGAIASDAVCNARKTLYLIPSVIFNIDGVTLDDMTLDDIKASLASDIACCVHVVTPNPLDYMQQITDLAE